MKFRIIKTGTGDIKLQRRILFIWFTIKRKWNGPREDIAFGTLPEAHEYAEMHYGTKPIVMFKFELKTTILPYNR